MNIKEDHCNVDSETLNTENNVAVSNCVVKKSEFIEEYETKKVQIQGKSNKDDNFVMDETNVYETRNE